MDFLEPIYVMLLSRKFVDWSNRGVSTHHEINCLTLDATLSVVVNNKQRTQEDPKHQHSTNTKTNDIEATILNVGVKYVFIRLGTVLYSEIDAMRRRRYLSRPGWTDLSVS